MTGRIEKYRLAGRTGKTAGFHLRGFSMRSVRFKLIAGVLMMLVPLLGFLFYNNVYSIGVIHSQVAESNRNMLMLYMNQIDSSLKNVDSYLNYLISYDADVQEIATVQDRDRRTLTKVAISDNLQASVVAYTDIGSLFFYCTNDRDYIYSYNTNSDVRTRTQVGNRIREILSDVGAARVLTKKGWFTELVGERWYLVRIMPAFDNFTGAWIDVRNLLMPLNLISLGSNGAALLTTDDGEPMAASDQVETNGLDLNGDFSRYYLSGIDNHYLVVGTHSAQSNMNLVAVIPDEKILENLPYLRRLIVAIAILAALLIPLSILYIRRIILTPMNRLVMAMQEVGEGNIEVRVEDRPTSTEFAMLDRTFNSMLDEIHDLRISVYEEQLHKQKAELEHLQLQVNPHFFLNSLNIIYRLAQTNRTSLIQEMSMSLIQYFRYMFRNRRPVVPLREELDHVRNYLRIQELRFPDQLIKEIRATEVLMDTPVPPLLIQNFVENAVKYAVSGEKPLNLLIAVDLADADGEACLAIRIQDDGPGFPPEVLEDLQAGRRIQKDDGEHVGAWNARKRLELLYGTAAGISFGNADPVGAWIDIRLPLVPQRDGKGEGAT